MGVVKGTARSVAACVVSRVSRVCVRARVCPPEVCAKPHDQLNLET